MKINRFLWIFSLLLFLTFTLTACAGDGESEESGDADEKEEGEKGGDLTIAVDSDVVSLSTHGDNDVPSTNVQDNIYETLTTMDEDQEVQPGLAEDWEQVDDTTWEFYLEEGVEFHDGEELTAEAVKKNFDRLMDDDIGSPRAFLLEAVEDVEAEDDYTVRIDLEYEYAPLLANLAHTGTAIMSPDSIDEDYEAMEEDDEDPDSYINKNPAGTGPFEYDDWTPGEEVVLKRNDDYWGDNANLDSVAFKVVDEQSTRIAELDSGETDVADAIGSDNVSRVEEDPDSDVLQEPSAGLSYVGFNTQKEPFDDKKVRQAVSMAIDNEELVEGVYNGMGIPADGPLAPPVFGYDDSIEGFDYDPEEAKELLAEAGYEDGFDTTIWTNDEDERMDTAVAVQSQLSEIDIDVEIEEMEWGAYLEETANGEHDMFVLGWEAVTADADYGMYPLFHSSQHGDPGNRSFLDNEEVDEILEEARRETDEDKREELYSEAQELLVDVAPMLYIHHKEHLLGVNDDVKDFEVDAEGLYQFDDAYIE